MGFLSALGYWDVLDLGVEENSQVESCQEKLYRGTNYHSPASWSLLRICSKQAATEMPEDKWQNRLLINPFSKLVLITVLQNTAILLSCTHFPGRKLFWSWWDMYRIALQSPPPLRFYRLHIHLAVISSCIQSLLLHGKAISLLAALLLFDALLD